MYINKSDEPIAAFRSDNYTRASLAICTLGIVVLSIASVVYQSISIYDFTIYDLRLKLLLGFTIL